MKIDPCLDCGHLLFRKDNEPPPERCPNCGRANLLRVDPRTGRAPANERTTR